MARAQLNVLIFIFIVFNVDHCTLKKEKKLQKLLQTFRLMVRYAQILGWPKTLFDVFRKMDLVALNCL